MADCNALASAQHELVEPQNMLDAAKQSDLLRRFEPQQLSDLLVTPNIYDALFGCLHWEAWHCIGLNVQ
jgi:hypothetical protein